MLNETHKAGVRALAQDLAFAAAEIYSSLLTVNCKDASGRGITNFTGQQAFELTRTVLYETMKDQGTT